ncbi:hypothetical protein AB9P05_21475 [Roseivirga sp. BDSF3-8]|uniref:hypothetical protein n=1 Tax=Roseivirga sp. BDSF3-8 TaxID=3241598 RepID=UPI003532148E
MAAPNIDDEKIESFWDWFTENRRKYTSLQDLPEEEVESLLEEFLAALHEVNQNLYFEIGGLPDTPQKELIITAEGDKEYFPLVEEVVDQAPFFPEWDIIAFKQPAGPDFVISYEDQDFEPEQTLFIPIEPQTDDAITGLRVCYADYNEGDKGTFLHGTYLMLDYLLGEKSSTLDIDHLEVGPIPVDGEASKPMPLSGIKAYIDGKREEK